MSARVKGIGGRPALLLLAFGAGVTDAISYISLGQVFTANMTGNTVLLGIAIVDGDGARIARSGCALGAFCVGVALASALAERRASAGVRPALACEAVLLAALAAAGGAAGSSDGNTVWLIVIAGLAMGTQSGLVLAAGPSGIATTYITGTLSRFVAALTRRAGAGRSPAERAGDGSVSAALIWAAYLAAALAGAGATRTWHMQAAWIACAAVVAVATLA